MGISARYAKETALKVWRYFAAHPDVRCKDDLPGDLFALVRDMVLNCPLCEFFLGTDSPASFCGFCPLSSCTDGGPYTDWVFSQSHEDRSFYANRIVGIIEAWDPYGFVADKAG